MKQKAGSEHEAHGLNLPSGENVWDWRNILPEPPFIERKFTSLGLHFFRASAENAKHDGSLSDGYLVCMSNGPPFTLRHQTEYIQQSGHLFKGDINVTPPCERLFWEVIGKAEMTCLYASKSYLEQIIASLGMAMDEPIVLKKEFQLRDRMIEGVLEAINKQFEINDYRDHIYIEAMARAIFIHLLHKNLKTSARPWNGYQRSFSYEQMEKIRAYITERMEERILSAELARCVHVSDYHFYRIFKRTTGMTPQQFIKNYRLEKARTMLEHTQLSVYEVAYKTGFSDSSHLGREFKALFGISPQRLRSRVEYDRNFVLAL